MSAYGKVGKKGTLYPPKNLREKLGLKEGDSVKYVVKSDTLLVVKIPDPLEVSSEFNIPFNVKRAVQLINQVGKESESEVEEEILKKVKKIKF